ncbi:phage protein [Photobacterium halotolerans]|uniref:Tail protein n=1 Tax=Photobacterium halotolerans TaxID=265726 RepID=A0A0F5VHS1_9GAMM|nr:phage protein [Photobacterium halotolerans]KKD01387.1 tail protein [Photobacterium halotolerans]
MTARFSGRSFDTTLFGEFVHVKNATATINDESAAAFTRGVTDGYTDGKVSCDVEIELDLNQFRKIHKAAKSAGSYRGIKPDDLLFYANNGVDEDKVELFGVKWVLADIVGIDPDSADLSTRKIKGFVTSPLFVNINGTPYLDKNDTRGLLS